MAVPCAHFVLKLVHTELTDYQLHFKCKKHSVTHRGFFYVSKNHAMRVIQKWRQWMLQDPYMRNADGRLELKPPFKAQIAEICRPLAMES